MAVTDKPEGIVALATDGSKLPKDIRLDVDISRIGKVKGNWAGQVVLEPGQSR